MRSIDAGGTSVHYVETGSGAPLVHLQPGGPPRLTRAHEILARTFRVIAFESPASADDSALVSTMSAALAALGLADVNLMATSSASPAALLLAQKVRAKALVLESPSPLRSGANLAAPTLLLFGTADRTTPAATGRAYKDTLPNSHLVYVYAAGSEMGVDRPEAFADVVSDFLERHEAFVVRRTTTVIHP